MITYRTIQSVERNDASVVTVGTFDGVHRGHRSVIERMKGIALEKSLRTVIVTFDPHPQIVLNKQGREPIKLLTSLNERVKLLSQTGIDALVVLPFTFEFSQTSAEDFIKEYIIERIGVQHFLIGFDHMFGRNRSGNDGVVSTLAQERGFVMETAPPLMMDDTDMPVKISSTQIRNALKSGDLRSANEMLGYHYSLEGIVVQGDGRGRHLGYPTANVESLDIHKLYPKNGVYLVSAYIDGILKYGMANIGTRPTFTDDLLPRLEVHFFDVNAYLYDRKLSVTFHEYIRPEMKFESVDMFWSQLRDDRDKCEELIAKRTMSS